MERSSHSALKIQEQKATPSSGIPDLYEEQSTSGESGSCNLDEDWDRGIPEEHESVMLEQQYLKQYEPQEQQVCRLGEEGDKEEREKEGDKEERKKEDFELVSAQPLWREDKEEPSLTPWTYAGLIYYQEKGREDLVAFAAARSLKELIEVRQLGFISIHFKNNNGICIVLFPSDIPNLFFIKKMNVALKQIWHNYYSLINNGLLVYDCRHQKSKVFTSQDVIPGSRKAQKRLKNC